MFHLKFTIITGVKNCSILHRHVIVIYVITFISGVVICVISFLAGLGVCLLDKRAESKSENASKHTKSK